MIQGGLVENDLDLTPSLSSKWLDKAKAHVDETLRFSLMHHASKQAVVVWDDQSVLSRTLYEAYLSVLPTARFIRFGSMSPECILQIFETLSQSDLVVLIQSTNFRLNPFRLRVELFKRSLKVIEHVHLGHMQGEEAQIYIESLAYDPGYYRETGKQLKQLMDSAQQCVVEGEGASLLFSSGLEPSSLNVGDYAGRKNVGGQFPIGEVFSESKDLCAVNGELNISSFGDVHFCVNEPPKPIRLIVRQGRVVSTEASTPDFDEVLSRICHDEGEIWVRELGFGLNRAFSRKKKVKDIGTYERMCGVHLSLGSKHNVYIKPQFNRRKTKHHVDVMAVADGVWLDNRRVYQDGRWTVF